MKSKNLTDLNISISQYLTAIAPVTITNTGGSASQQQ
jgi:hypothetical protein